MKKDRPEVVEFFASLHTQVFKPQGFKKTRRTFIRKQESFSIAFQFQGSSWNDANSPWRFYLNSGIQFHGIPRRNPDKDFPTIHSWTRIDKTLSGSAETQYEIATGKIEELVRQIEAVVGDCINYFTKSHSFLEKAYHQKPVSYLGYLDETLLKNEQ